MKGRTIIMTLPRRDTLHHTYGEYLTWPDDERYELINGIAYVKEPPAPSRLHQELVGELYFQIRLALEGKPYRAYIAPFDIRLPRSGEADEQVATVVQPDVLIVRNLGKLDERGMRGAPDWIAEILSPSTASYDQMIKIPIYERCAVREVWLVHPVGRTVTVYRLESGHYRSPVILEMRDRMAIEAIPGVSIDWNRVLAALA
jgi:Uma2 family endonuclease